MRCLIFGYDAAKTFVALAHFLPLLLLLPDLQTTTTKKKKMMMKKREKKEMEKKREREVRECHKIQRGTLVGGLFSILHPFRC